MIEVRCPLWTRTKFCEVHDGATGEADFACRTCRRAARDGGREVEVVHTVDLATGVALSTVEVPRDTQ